LDEGKQSWEGSERRGGSWIGKKKNSGGQKKGGSVFQLPLYTVKGGGSLVRREKRVLEAARASGKKTGGGGQQAADEVHQESKGKPMCPKVSVSMVRKKLIGEHSRGREACSR